MIDIKKLITGFLALAILTSSGAFVFSSFFEPNKETQQVPEGQLSDSLSTIGDNAFVEPLSQVFQDPQALSEELNLPPIIKSDNFTENLASQLTREMTAANPEDYEALTSQLLSLSGRVSDVSGEVIDRKVAQKLIDDFEAEILLASSNFKVKKNYGPEDVNNYVESLNTVLEKNLLGSWIQTLEGQGPSTQGVDALSVIVQRISSGVNGLEVPESLQSFHRSFLKVLAYGRGVSSLTNSAGDPLRAAMIFESQELNFNLALSEFQTELQKVNSLEGISLSGSADGLTGFAVGVFQPKVAHAFLGIGDISFDPANLLQMLWEWGKKVGVELLKDKLVNMLMNQTLNWIKGGGEPKYITDFGGFIADAADQAAGNALYEISPALCSSFGPLVKLALTPVPNIRDRTRCTISQVIDSATNFYNNFSDGGWIGYAYAINPSNNLFGSIIQVHDEVVRAAAAESEKKKTEAEANSGFKSTKVCGKTSVHRYDEIWKYVAGPPSPNYQYSTADARLIAGEAGEEVIEKSLNPNPQGKNTFEACPPNGWENTTPGGAVAHSLYTALDAPLHRIVNAQDLIGLAAAFVNSVLNKLIQSGVDGLRGTSGRTVRQPINASSSCAYILNTYSAISTEYADCIRDVQDIASSTQQITLSRSDLLKAADIYITNYTKVVDLGNDWLIAQPDVLDLLRDVASVCDGLTEDEKSELDRLILDITFAELTIKRDIVEAKNMIAALEEFIFRVSDATDEELAVLTYELENKFSLTFLNIMLDEAHERAKLLNEIKARWKFKWDSMFNVGAFPPNLCLRNGPVSSCFQEPDGTICVNYVGPSSQQVAVPGTCQSQTCIPN